MNKQIIIITLSTITGNFLYAGLFDQSFMVALERSYFQAVLAIALIVIPMFP